MSTVHETAEKILAINPLCKEVGGILTEDLRLLAEAALASEKLAEAAEAYAKSADGVDLLTLDDALAAYRSAVEKRSEG